MDKVEKTITTFNRSVPELHNGTELSAEFDESTSMVSFRYSSIETQLVWNFPVMTLDSMLDFFNSLLEVPSIAEAARLQFEAAQPPQPEDDLTDDDESIEES